MDPLIELDGARFVAGAGPRVSLRLGPGDIAIVPRSPHRGAGAVLAAVRGLAPLCEGAVRLLGVDPARARPREAEMLSASVGYLCRPGDLLSNVSLEANLMLPIRYHRRIGSEEAAQAGARALSWFGVSWPLPYALPADAPVALARRVALARAVMLEPRVLLLEDFRADLAAQEGQALGYAVRSYARTRGAGVLLVGDDPALAATLGACLLEGAT